MVIHLGTHYHLVVNERCEDVVPQVNLLFKEEVLQTPSTIKFIIALVISKTVLFMQLLNKDGDGFLELLWGDKLNHVTDNFVELYFFNVKNLVSSLKHCLGNQNCLSNTLASNIEVITTTFRTTIFQVNNIKKKCSFSRCPCMEMLVDLIWCSICNIKVTFKDVGSCLIMWNMWNMSMDVRHWLATCIIWSIVKWWLV